MKSHDDIIQILNETALDTASRRSLVDGVMQRIETAKAPQRRSFWLSWPGLLKPALAPVLCLLLLAVVYYSLPNHKATPGGSGTDGLRAERPAYASQKASRSPKLMDRGDYGNDKIGFIDTKGNIVIPQIYTATSGPFSEGMCAVNVSKRGSDEIGIDGQWGYIDRSGHMVIQPQFEQAWGFHEGLAPVRANGRWGFIDTRGKFVIPPQYEQVFPYREGLATVSVNDKFGFIDRTGTMVIAPQFDTPGFFKDGRAIVATKKVIDTTGNIERVHSVIDRHGKVILGPESGQSLVYAEASEGLTPVLKEKLFGYIDDKGQTVIPYMFRSANAFKNSVARVILDATARQDALIDKTGKIVAGPVKHVQRDLRYDPETKQFLAGYFRPRKEKTVEKPFDFGTMLPYPELYFDSDVYTEGMIRVKVGKDQNERVGFVDSTGRFVIPPRFRFVGQFVEGLALFTGDVLSATETPDYNKAIAPEMIAEATSARTMVALSSDIAAPANEGWPDYSHVDAAMHAALQNARWGFFDKTGRVAIQPVYKQVFDFSEALALVREPDAEGVPGRWCYIDKKGYTVIVLPYDEARSFSDGLAAVRMNGKWGFIDRMGTLRIPFQYDYVEDFHDGRAIITKNRKSGFIDKSGRIAVEPIHDLVRRYSEELAIVGVQSATPGIYQCSIIDTAGRLKPISEPLKAIAPFSEGLALAWSHNGMWGYIDTDGEVALPFQFPGAHFGVFINGRAWIKDMNQGEGNWYGYIDKSGQWVKDPVRLYDLTPVYKKDKGIVVGRSGYNADYSRYDAEHPREEPLDYNKLWPIFDSESRPADYTRNRLRKVHVESNDGTKYAYMDASGQVVFTLEPGMEEPREFSEGLAAFATNVDWQAYDRTMRSLNRSEW